MQPLKTPTFYVATAALLTVVVAQAYFKISIHTIKAESAAALAACEKTAEEPGPDVVYALFWLDYECSFVTGKLPVALRPLACDPDIRVYRAASLPKVISRLQDLGPGVPAALYAERGVREKAVEFIWEPKRGK